MRSLFTANKPVCRRRTRAGGAANGRQAGMKAEDSGRIARRRRREKQKAQSRAGKYSSRARNSIHVRASAGAARALAQVFTTEISRGVSSSAYSRVVRRVGSAASARCSNQRASRRRHRKMAVE